MGAESVPVDVRHEGSGHVSNLSHGYDIAKLPYRKFPQLTFMSLWERARKYLEEHVNLTCEMERFTYL